MYSQKTDANPTLTIFSACLFVICFILSTIIPPFQSPDESDHVARAYLLTKRQILLDAPEGKSSGGMIDSGLASYIEAYPGIRFNTGRRISAEEIESAKQIHWSREKQFFPAPGTGYNFPLLYTPQALGLFIGQKLDLSIDTSFRLARSGALIASFLVIYLAFRIYSPPLSVMALLILPMTVFQLSSASLDGIATALSIFAISVFMRISTDKSPEPWLLYALAVSVILAASSRAHLVPLILLIGGSFFFNKRRESLVAAATALILVALWFLISVNTTVDTRVVKGAPTSGIIYFYLTDPFAFFDILFATLGNSDLQQFYAESFIGILGWLDSRFDNSTYIYIYSLLIAIFATSLSFKGIRREWFKKLLLTLCATSSLLIIFFALLVAWNPHPAQIIQGVQGRYFLVPAILMAYAFERGQNSKFQAADKIGLILTVCLLLFSTQKTLNLLIARYYTPAEQPRDERLLRQPSAELRAEDLNKWFT